MNKIQSDSRGFIICLVQVNPLSGFAFFIFQQSFSTSILYPWAYWYSRVRNLSLIFSKSILALRFLNHEAILAWLWLQVKSLFSQTWCILAWALSEWNWVSLCLSFLIRSTLWFSLSPIVSRVYWCIGLNLLSVCRCAQGFECFERSLVFRLNLISHSTCS